MSLSSREQDNLTRWKESQKGFYEVYYLKWNDLAVGVAVWLRYTLLAPIKGPAEVSVWGIFFDTKDPSKNIGLKNNFPLADARIERDVFYFAAGPSAIYDEGARGEIVQGANKMSWELKFEEPSLSLRHYPAPLYWGKFPKTKFLAPYLSMRLSGEFRLNDRRFTLNQLSAHQGHLWGTEMAHSWVWGNCNAFQEDETFCFEGISAQVKVGERLTPPMTLLFFYWEGKLYRMSGPSHWVTNRSEHGLDRWHLEGKSGDLLFTGDIFARTEEMAGVRYQDPNGSERFCHNTKTADMKVQILRKRKSGWEPIKAFSASHSAAFERVLSGLDPQVKLLIP